MKYLAVVFAIALGITFAAQPSHAMSSGGSESPMLPDFKAGVMAMKNGNFAESETLLRKVVASTPNHADAWSLIGFVSRKSGKVDEAFKAYEKSLSIDPEFRPALNYLGHLYLELGQLDKAKDLLSRLSSACFFGCPEYDDLKSAVEAGKSGKY